MARQESQSQGEANIEPFVCDCDEHDRPACERQPFYKEDRGKQYCVLHYPGEGKSNEFREALNGKLQADDFDFRGVSFPEEITFAEFRFTKFANFRAAIFNDTVQFHRARFEKGASFYGVSFEAQAWFIEASFGWTADFGDAVFNLEAIFSRASFDGDVDFTNASLRGEGSFNGTSFGGKTYFVETHFHGWADFIGGAFKSENHEAEFTSSTFESGARFESSTFNGNVTFAGTRFSSVTDFSAAQFYSEAYFAGAQFLGDTNFDSVIFRNEASFLDAFFAEKVVFTKSRFEGEADFIATRFGGPVQFGEARFAYWSEFLGAKFAAGADFGAAQFDSSADFRQAEFGKESDFSYCTFTGEVDFRQATFSALISFEEASLGDSVRFSGKKDAASFGSNDVTLDLQFAKIEKPERVSFHTLTLSPCWFVNTDARSFEFSNVKWNASIDAEIQLLHRRGFVSPTVLLETSYRQLAVNHEENQRYRDASKFRYLAMELGRRDMDPIWEEWYDFAFWRLDWWYWATSGYGERVIRASAILIGVWVMFGLFYTQVGFTEPVAIRSEPDRVGEPLRARALIYSFRVMSLQKPEPQPLTITAEALVGLEMIIGPAQATLLLLAIRRRFMR